MTNIIRDDLSNRLVHLTKGDGEQAATSFLSIVDQQMLVGGNGMIKGKESCICFSEAPISKLGYILAQPRGPFKYMPYGVMFTKRYVFEKGGRPVIYQPGEDYETLPAEKRHLHVRFELRDRVIDFTWEREWRLKADRLSFTPDDVTLIVPNRAFGDVFRESHQDADGRCPWHYISLDDLGITIDHGIN